MQISKLSVALDISDCYCSFLRLNCHHVLWFMLLLYCCWLCCGFLCCLFVCSVVCFFVALVEGFWAMIYIISVTLFVRSGALLYINFGFLLACLSGSFPLS
jgi:hypothetical protein